MLVKMSDTGNKLIRQAFRDNIELMTLYRCTYRMAMLSGIEPEWYDCCINSCMCYTGKYADKSICLECKEPRYQANNVEPRRQFCYLPLIPRFKNLFKNQKYVEALSYQSKYQHNQDEISDVFDEDHYRSLLNKRVKVDGHRLSHTYFSDKRDIAFGTSMDSYLLYKRRRNGPSALPILIQLYNLPPESRTRLENLFCVGIIPGPHQPKHLDTFLIPLEAECTKLAKGVRIFDCTELTMFDLHAYNMFPIGDILEMEKLKRLKGHNSFVPCRSCKIQAVCDHRATKKTYYAPLKSKTTDYNPRNLPMRKHDDWKVAVTKLEKASSKKR